MSLSYHHSRSNCQNRSKTVFQQGDLCFTTVPQSIHRECKMSKSPEKTECWWLGRVERQANDPGSDILHCWGAVTGDRGSEKAWQVQGVLQLGFSERNHHHCNLTGMIVKQCIFTQCSMAAAKHIHSVHETFHNQRGQEWHTNYQATSQTSQRANGNQEHNWGRFSLLLTGFIWERDS